MKGQPLNQRGVLTLDFLFALVIVITMMLAFGIFSFSLSLVEAAQYTAFASSRAYFSANVSYKDQKENAQAKFNQLISKNNLGLFLRPTWIQLKPNWGDFGDTYKKSDPHGIFDGARIDIKIKLLEFSIPLLGAVSKPDGFLTVVTSFLGREVSNEECLQFNKDRFIYIKKLRNEFSNNAVKDSEYGWMADNGC